MTWLIERLSELRRHIDHLRSLRPRVVGRESIHALERLPGFRNVLVHEYVALDLDRVLEAMDDLEPIERFAGIVTAMLRERST